MIALSRTETAEQRAAIFNALTRRNRLIGQLRIWLPVAGAVGLAAIITPFVISSLMPKFGFANISIDRNNLVVEAPSYSGVGADGTLYSVSAGTARAALDNTDLIELSGAQLTINQPDGTIAYAAEAGAAQLTVSTQQLKVDGPARVEGLEGLAGTIADARVDLINETMVSEGPATIMLPDGTIIEAATMMVDRKAGLWSFKQATVTLAAMPGADAEVATETDVPLRGEMP